MNAKDLCNKFNIDPISIKELGQGLINGSYVVTDKNNKRYLLQEINSRVFRDIDAVMHNIEKTTTHIRNKALTNGTDPERSSLRVIPTVNGEFYTTIYDSKDNPHYYRMFNFIEDSSTYDQANENIVYECGVGFGKFQKDLSDFPADILYETIPDFHNTHARYINFMNLLFKLRKEQQHSKIIDAYPEIMTAVKYGLKYADTIVSALENGELPLRVVHNDTKINNVMIDNKIHKAVCAIDLDTVMPGSLLYDYGDAIRSCANTGLEDDENLNNVRLDLPKFKAFTKGYLSQVADCITKEELELMAQAPAILAYELGLRFLTDYLDGNQYFKCNPARPKHNLERAQAQFKLMKDFETHEKFMQNIIMNLYKKIAENEFI